MVKWASDANEPGNPAAGLQWQTRGSLESDGFMALDVAVRNDGAAPAVLSGSSLVIPLSAQASPFAMGFEIRGGTRPDSLEWKWADHVGQQNNKIWVGGAHAGLKLTLLGTTANWSQFDLPIGKDDIPLAWAGDDQGGGCVLQTHNGTGGGSVINCTAGRTTIGAGGQLHFRFNVLVTPLKPLGSAHWGQRHFQLPVGSPNRWTWSDPECFDTGANVVTWHQGLDGNPFINWPFDERAQAMYLDNFVEGAHAVSAERKVLVYFTTREATIAMLLFVALSRMSR